MLNKIKIVKNWKNVVKLLSTKWIQIQMLSNIFPCIRDRDHLNMQKIFQFLFNLSRLLLNMFYLVLNYNEMEKQPKNQV